MVMEWFLTKTRYVMDEIKHHTEETERATIQEVEVLEEEIDMMNAPHLQEMTIGKETVAGVIVGTRTIRGRGDNKLILSISDSGI